MTENIHKLKTPFFTLSKSKIMEQYKIAEDLSDIVSYSSKTNPEITPILENETDCMFSVHTTFEMKNVKDASRIQFLAQAWNDKIITDLINQGVRWFIVDNESDLNILLDHLKNNDTPNNDKINLMIRLKLKENSIRTEKYYVFGMFSDTIRQKVNEITSDEKLNSKIDGIGIHFHRKSQNMSEWNLKYELEYTFDEEFWKKINLVSIGGGIPSVYANTNVNVFSGIFDKIKELKEWFNTYEIKMTIEPGRFIAAPAGELHSKVIGIHENTIIVDASVYNGDLDALVVPVKLLIKEELNREQMNERSTEDKENIVNYVIKGITPCSMDIFRYKVFLEKKHVGDNIIFINAGAYNFASDFCDMEKVKTIIVD